MKIVYDARTINNSLTGVGNYSLSIIKNLLEIDKDNSYYCLCNSTAILGRELNNYKNVRFIQVAPSNEDHPSNELWENGELLKMLEDLKCDIFHGPAYLIPWKKKKSLKTKFVLTIHDLSFLRFPLFFPPKFSTYLKWLLNRTIYAADIILADSLSTKSDIIFSYKIEKSDNIEVVYCGASDKFYKMNEVELSQKAQQYNLPEKYFLSVGTIEPRKNHIKALQIFEQLKIENNIPYKLIIVGGNGWQSEHILNDIKASPFINDVIIKGFVSDEELNIIYNKASVLFYFSHYEGFGIPLLEAMKCGCPVIAAKNSSIPEVVGETGLLFDMKEDEPIKKEISKLILGKEYSDKLSQISLNQSNNFSWQSSAQKILDIFNYLNKQ